MPQCNIVTGCCLCCAAVTFFSAGGAYYFYSNQDYSDTGFWTETSDDSIVNYNKTRTVKVVASPIVYAQPKFEVYYKVSEGVDCQTTAANIEVTYSCSDTTSCSGSGKRNLTVVCEERVNQLTETTMMTVVTFAPISDDDGTVVAATYTAKAPVSIFLRPAWITDTVFQGAGEVAGILFGGALATCGGFCCIVGLVAYICTASPVTQPQVEMPPQMAAQPLQQPAMAHGQYGQYGGTQP